MGNPSERRPMKAAEKIEQGIYELVAPLDYMILDFMPEEGAMFAGLYPLGETAANLLKKFTPEQQKAMKSTLIAARLVSLNVQKLAINMRAGGTTEKRVWQRTKKGTEVLNEWKETNGGDHE